MTIVWAQASLRLRLAELLHSRTLRYAHPARYTRRFETVCLTPQVAAGTAAAGFRCGHPGCKLCELAPCSPNLVEFYVGLPW